ncbi:MAG: chemotaxis protein CheB [Pseudomonadales bacterium]|nr:chemotaxis protein CheB [Pseudomonadales bacterium]
MTLQKEKYRAVVIGASWGGMNALQKIFSQLTNPFKIPILVVLHQDKTAGGGVIDILNIVSTLPVIEAEEKQKILPGFAYLAPPNYHLLVESNKTLSLCISEKVNYCRPSVDVLFESAADIYRHALLGIVLTGANNDGANGARYIREKGGGLIVQSPEEAEMPTMPNSALEVTTADFVLDLDMIAEKLNELANAIDKAD